MKAITFILAVIFFISPFSGYSLSNGNAHEDEKTTDRLYAMGGQLEFDEDGKANLIPPEELLFTGDDIISYNQTTKEIVFADSIFDKILDGKYGVMNLYMNDTLLFENIIFMSSASSWTINDLVLFYEESKFYLCYMNPGWDGNIGDMKAGWDIFIKYLTDNDKVIGNTGIVDVNTVTPAQIYSAGKIIYVNNPTGKNTILTVYGINGVKVAEQTTVNQTTKLEMPVSGFYLVSVKTEDEKPVTKKLMVR